MLPQQRWYQPYKSLISNKRVTLVFNKACYHHHRAFVTSEDILFLTLVLYSAVLRFIVLVKVNYTYYGLAFWIGNCHINCTCNNIYIQHVAAWEWCHFIIRVFYLAFFRNLVNLKINVSVLLPYRK